MPPDTDQQLMSLAQNVVLSHDRFSSYYDPLAAQHGADRFMVLKVVSGAATSPFYSAFVEARRGGWLDKLCFRLTEAGGIRTDSDQVRIELHKVIQPRLGFLDAMSMNRAGLEAVSRVCRVAVTEAGGSVSYGTGFLVGPQAILTAWHVIECLLDSDGPKAGSAQRIRIEFDYVGADHQPESISVADHWLVAHSTYHPSERPSHTALDFNAQPSTGFDQCLDYAGIRLSSAVGRKRGYYKLDKTNTPQTRDDGSQMTLYQHPGGQQMRVAHGHGIEMWPVDYQTRLRHSVNALAGSSGGLLLDVNFRPVALHQCGITTNGEVINGAIPTACIAARCDDVLETVVGFDPAWRIEPGNQPIIGRRRFQQAVQDCMLGHLQMIAVVGQRQSGKTFSLEILRSMLRHNAQHIILSLRAARLEGEPAAFAQALLARVAAPGQAPEPLPDLSDSDTAADAWIRDVLFPEFARQMNALADNRQLWVVIDELDVNPVLPGLLQHFLEQLYQGITEIPQLRIVLLGSKRLLPGARGEVLCTETLAPLTEPDLLEYLQLSLANHDPGMTQAEIARHARVIIATLQAMGEEGPKGMVTYLQQIFFPSLEPA